jgi:S1-C subfamily serine protease
MSSGLLFTIDKNSIALIIDEDESQPIGTAFIFIQPYWAVTAKHVVLRDGEPRENLQLMFTSNLKIPVKLLYAHPSVDLAVLSIPDCPCKFPLFPAHHGFGGSEGLATAGYAPSKTVGNSYSIVVNYVPSFSTERRERSDGYEDVVIFDSNFTEGGHSGGPVFGSGGGVVGVILEQYETGKTHATALAPLLQQLTFRETKRGTEPGIGLRKLWTGVSES